MWISISSSETCWNYYLAGLHVAQPCRYCFYSVLLLFTLLLFLLVLKLLVILYSSDTQYSFGYFTVKTKAYNIIISHIVQLWLLFKKVISFCLNSTVEQYNIIAKFGTFFMSHPVYYSYCRSHPETWLITENNVRRTNRPTGEEGLRETKNNAFGLATEYTGRQYQLRRTKDVRPGQV